MWTGISSRRISACPSRRRAPSAKERKQTRCLETAASKCRCRGGAGRCDAGWGARHGRTGQFSPCPGTQTSSSWSSDAACWVAGGGGGRKGCEMMERAKMAARRRLEVAGVEGCGPSAVGRGLAVTGLLVRAANRPRHGCAARSTEESHQESETSMVDFHAGRLWKMIPLPLAPLFTACGGGNSWRGHFQRHGFDGMQSNFHLQDSRLHRPTHSGTSRPFSGQAALDMCNVAPTRSSPRSIAIMYLLLGSRRASLS